jgi:hypothetical protein
MASDLSWCNIPKRKKIPNGRKIYQMSLKYTNIINYKALQNVPKLGFSVCKCTIWQPCIHMYPCKTWSVCTAAAICRQKPASRVTRWVGEKIAQSVAQQTFFCQNVCKKIILEKKSKGNIYAIFTKLTKVNNDPIGGNSPDLVTLPES